MRLGFADPLSAPFLRVLRREWAGRKTVAGEGVRSGRRGRTDGLGVSSWIQGTLDWSLWLSRRRLIRFCSAGVLVTVRGELCWLPSSDANLSRFSFGCGRRVPCFIPAGLALSIRLGGAAGLGSFNSSLTALCFEFWYYILNHQ
ncbi:peroxisomal (S)-2-hydroxy-acid oxidase [Striga asiatica]|uniref:Peroxisomal (S)-2-hydroxy-acid oxidase n=1 Tax=Striga asiatica TaxID=4170 RepID=A0A5A7QZ52_STRAF|nr:peroxisomal (S)-2-hydroxy-acid oxidase [Striga asiatica]